MTKTAKAFALLGGVILIGIGIWLAAPLFYDKRVSEDLPGSEALDSQTLQSAEILQSGQFQGADSFHQAGGTAQVVTLDGKAYVRFEDDFTVTNGPDLYVYFGKDGQYDADTNIGRLKGNVGSQNYEVPAGIDLSNYNEVWVWCRAFAVPFGHAVLQ